jgi:hypothetical protein
MTPDDWRQMLRDAPVAALLVVGLWAFLSLLIVFVPGPTS